MAGIDLQLQDMNLTSLEREPIHICGQIQPHGVLFVLEEPVLKILQVSNNTSAVLGISPENLLQKKIEEVLEPFPVEKLTIGLSRKNFDFINPVKIWLKKKEMIPSYLMEYFIEIQMDF